MTYFIPLPNKRFIKSARKKLDSSEPSVKSDGLRNDSVTIVDLTSDQECCEETPADSLSAILRKEDTPLKLLKSTSKQNSEQEDSQKNEEKKLEWESVIESVDNNEDSKNCKDFAICLQSNRDIKQKKIEYLQSLIEDELRTDYLSPQVLKNKVSEIYEKFKDFEARYEWSFSSNDDEKAECESVPYSLSEKGDSGESNSKSSNWMEDNQNEQNSSIPDSENRQEENKELDNFNTKRNGKVFNPSKELMERRSPKVMFSGPDKRNHWNLEQILTDLMFRTKFKISICSYTIANGVLSLEMATELRRRWGDNFRIITDQMQMTNKNLKKYSNDLVALGVPIKKNNNAKNLMHWKFMIIDDMYLVEGSMNMGEK